jgi:hypothetical protein
MTSASGTPLPLLSAVNNAGASAAIVKEAVTLPVAFWMASVGRSARRVFDARTN